MTLFPIVQALISSAVIERLGWTLLHSLWQFAVLALVAGIAIRTLRGQSAVLRYNWLAGMLSMFAVSPLATWLVVPSDSPTESMRFARPEQEVGDFSLTLLSMPVGNAPLLRHSIDGQPLPNPAVAVGAVQPPCIQPAQALFWQSWSERTAAILRPWLAWVVGSWCVGVLICSLRPLLGWWMLWRLKSVGVSAVAADVQATVSRMSARLGLRHTVSILQSTLVEELRGPHTVLALGAADGFLLSRIRRIAVFNPERVSDRWSPALLGITGLGIVCLSCTAWGLAATAEIEDVLERHPRPVIAELPGGISVELVGVGYHPSKDRDWWRPDGGLLETRPALEGGNTVAPNSPEQAKCREFLIQIDRLPGDHAVTTDYGVTSSGGSTYSKGLWVGEYAAGPFQSKATSVRLGLTTEQFGPIVTIDAKGRKQAAAEMPDELRPYYDKVVPLGVEENEGRTVLLTESLPLNGFHNEADWELYAIDVDGENHRRTSISVSATDPRRFGFDIPRHRVDHFEYRLRPFRHWVTFENISLEPNLKSDATAKVASLPQLDAQVLAERFLTAIRRQQIPYLDEAKLRSLSQILQHDIAAHIKRPLSPARCETLAAAVAAVVRREFDPAEGDALYLEFQNRFQTLNWELGRALERPELTAAQTVQRESQRNWMRAEIEKLPESYKFQLRHKTELAKLESLFDDPLNPFFQEPMSDEDFTRFQAGYTHKMNRDHSESRLVAACNRLFQAAFEVLRGRLLRQSPVQNFGLKQFNLRWSLIAARQAGNSTLHLNDLHRQVRDIYVDVPRMIFVPGDAPVDLAARAAWLQEQAHGDLVFDAKSDALIGVRGAKIAVMNAKDWWSADLIPIADLRKLIATSGQDSVPLSIFVEIVGDPAHGIKRPRAAAPSLALQTKERRIAVVRISDISGDSPVISARPRPLPPNPPLHTGDVTTDGKLNPADAINEGDEPANRGHGTTEPVSAFTPRL